MLFLHVFLMNTHAKTDRILMQHSMKTRLKERVVTLTKTR